MNRAFFKVFSTRVPILFFKTSGEFNINKASDARKRNIHTMPGDVVDQECYCKHFHPFQIAYELMPCASKDIAMLWSFFFFIQTDRFVCGNKPD